MTNRVFGLVGASSGWPLSVMAVVIVLGQVCVLTLTKKGFRDHTLLSIGAAGTPAILLIGTVLWATVGGDQILSVLTPFFLLPLVVPYGMLGGMATFTRLVAEQLPEHQGKCQAVMQNLLALSGILAPAWLSWTYSESGADAEGPPFQSFV